MKLPIYNQLKQEISQCNECGLGSGIIGQGNLNARLVFLSEFPAKTKTTDKLYDRVLDQLNLKRKDVYTMNVICCAPDEYREPEPIEVRLCRPFFEQQLSLIRPKLVVAFGKFSASSMLGNVKITQDHGQAKWSEKFQVNVFPLYHPAYVGAYASNDKRLEFKQDILVLKQIIEEW